MRQADFLLASLLGIACTAGPSPAIADSPRFSCLSPDSGRIAFGTISKDTLVTWDASGVQFSLELNGDSLQGFVRVARGETGPERPLHDVRLDPATDSLTFWYASENGARYLYKYRFTCDALTGHARLFVTDLSAGLLRPDTSFRAPRITTP
jgi:hypothetical protein